MTKPAQFEKSILELETIVSQLEKGELSLEESLKKYEKGIQLANDCEKALTTAEQKIKTLSPSSQANTDLDNE